MTSKYPTSGPLIYDEVEGAHVVAKVWSIKLPPMDRGFWLHPYNPVESPSSVIHIAGVTRMYPTGLLIAMPGYPWDGSSGPTVDGRADPVPSLVHDILYEAMRLRKLAPTWRGLADQIYRELLIERGMFEPRAWLRWLGLRLFGGYAASPNRGAEYKRRSAN